jgi:hypothetical protein
MSPDVVEALAYFAPSVVVRDPPATEEMILAAEQRLGVPFPPSLRAFLRVHNGLRLPNDLVILGVPPPGETTPMDILSETTRHARRHAPETLICLTWHGTGDTWALLPALADERGEYPAAHLDHETGETGPCAASSYERFLWFQLDRWQRFFEPDGRPKQAYYQYVGIVPDDWEEEDDPEWLDEEPDLPWPYGDLAWMLERDPHLSRLRSG